MSVIVIAVCSVPAVWGLWARVAKTTRYGPIRLEDSSDTTPTGYIDEDGEATEYSVAEFEKSERWQKWGVVLLSFAGFGVSLAQAVVSTCIREQDKRHFIAPSWVQMVGWVSLAFPSSISEGVTDW